MLRPSVHAVRSWAGGLLLLIGCSSDAGSAPIAGPTPATEGATSSMQQQLDSARPQAPGASATGTEPLHTTGATAATAATAATDAPPPAPADLADAIDYLTGPLRSAAGDPDNAWALAHGVLAFGPDFETRDGTSAVDRLASFIERRQRGARTSLGFAAERAGLPVEPHPHTIVRALLDAGVPLERPLGAGGPTLGHLLSDLRADLELPRTPEAWHEIAWGMDALTLGGDAVEPVAGLRQAALAHLEAEQRVLLDSSGPPERAFDPDTPLGAAKRGKRAIFAHACGGLHLAQAVFRSVGRDGDAVERQRARDQLRAIARRFEIERGLYASILRARPDAALLISRQELKFFGHLAETLHTAVPLYEGAEARARLASLRAAVLGALVASVRRLRTVDAYAKLPTLAAADRQTQLDLIGDGCHALRALKLAAR